MNKRLCLAICISMQLQAPPTETLEHQSTSELATSADPFGIQPWRTKLQELNDYQNARAYLSKNPEFYLQPKIIIKNFKTLNLSPNLENLDTTTLKKALRTQGTALQEQHRAGTISDVELDNKKLGLQQAHDDLTTMNQNIPYDETLAHNIDTFLSLHSKKKEELIDHLPTIEHIIGTIDAYLNEQPTLTDLEKLKQQMRTLFQKLPKDNPFVQELSASTKLIVQQYGQDAMHLVIQDMNKKIATTLQALSNNPKDTTTQDNLQKLILDAFNQHVTIEELLEPLQNSLLKISKPAVKGQLIDQRNQQIVIKSQIKIITDLYNEIVTKKEQMLQKEQALQREQMLLKML